MLIKILKSGWLTHAPHDIANAYKGMSLTYDGNFSENSAFITRMVCFCDIPVEDFEIHMKKYSRFGLAFSKRFMIGKGANPVFYIANNSQLHLSSPLTEHFGDPPMYISKELPSKRDVTRAKFFDEVVIEFTQYLTAIEILLQEGKFDLEVRLIAALEEYIEGLPLTNEAEKNEERAFSAALGILKTRAHLPTRQRLFEIMEFIYLNCLCFMKMFDDTKTEDDPDNFYMEREWRVMGNIAFEVHDLSRIILPEQYAKRLRADLPDYYGQISFSG